MSFIHASQVLNAPMAPLHTPTFQPFSYLPSFSQLRQSPAGREVQANWNRFRDYWQGYSTELKKKIASINECQEWAAKKELILELINSPEFDVIHSPLKEVLTPLSSEHIDDLLKNCSLNNMRFQRCLKLFSLKQIEKTLKHLFAQFESHQEDLAKLIERTQHIIKHQKNPDDYLKEKIQSTSSYLLGVIQSIITTLLKATYVLELNREPESYYEASNMLNIYYKLISIPLLTLTAILTFFKSAVVGGIFAAGATLTTLTALFIYVKWINPVPQSLSKMENLTHDCKKGLIPPVIARENEIEKILDQLLARLNGAREHPLLIGPSGVGKSEIINGIAQTLLHPDLPEKYAPLKKLTVFYANAAWLKDKGFNFSELTTFQKIIRKVVPHKEQILVVCDEIVSLLDQDNANSLKTSLDANRPQGLTYFLGATTQEEYEKFIKVDAAIAGRFSKIDIHEMSKKQLIELLNFMAQRHAPDLTIDPEIFGEIYDLCKEFKIEGVQPTIGMNLLSKAFNKMRQILLNSEAETRLKKLQKKLKEKELSICLQDFEGNALHNDFPLLQEMESLEKKIAELDKECATRRQDFKHYSTLKTTLATLESKANHLARHISQHTPELSSEEEKKQLLLMHYYQLPALREEIRTFGKVKHFDIRLTKEIIHSLLLNPVP